MHYNSDQLRDYQFGLLDKTESAEMAVHLEACAECRTELERIQQQFSALDVLKEQPEAPGEMLENILNQKPPATKIIPFRPAAILAAAASIAIVLGVMLVGKGTGDDMRIADNEPARDRQAPSLSRELPKQQPARKVTGTANLPPAEPEPTLAELRAEPPFAPASNIELNVLPRRDNVQLTIYNAEDLTLVRETRRLTLKRGWNWLQFMWSNTLIDPTSLSLEPKTHTDQIEITQLVYPPRLNELARWTLFSEFSGEAEFELTYFTSGLKWNAFYQATLASDEQAMELKSFVRVDNGSGEDYEDAQTRLVVGTLNLVEHIYTLARQPAYQPLERLQLGQTPKPVLAGAPIQLSFGLGVDAQTQKQILKQALSEYQLYTIEGRETIPDGWGKRLPSFDAQEIGITNLYKFEQERWGEHTMRFLSFANTDACRLGETPLPSGRMRVFGKADETGSLVYVGAAHLQYIPVGEEVELELGAARKVMVEPKLMRTRTDSFEFDTKGNISGWDETTNWKIEITNAKEIPVKVEIMRRAGSTYWKIESDAGFEKYDAEHFRFIEELEPRSKKTITYELTVRHGTRQENHD